MDTARNRGSICVSVSRVFYTPENSERLCIPPCVLFNGHGGTLPPGVKPIINLKMETALPALPRIYSQLYYRIFTISSLLIIHFTFKTNDALKVQLLIPLYSVRYPTDSHAHIWLVYGTFRYMKRIQYNKLCMLYDVLLRTLEAADLCAWPVNFHWDYRWSTFVIPPPTSLVHPHFFHHFRS